MNESDWDIDAAAVAARLTHSTLEGFVGALVEELVRLHQANASLKARIVALEVTQTLQDRIAAAVPDPDGVELPRSLLIDAAFPLSAEAGFLPLDYDRAGRAIRWTGPEPLFRFELMLDRRETLAIALRFTELRLQTPGQRVRCFVDGVEIPAIALAIDGEFEIRATLPARPTPGGSVLMFLCPGGAAAGQSVFGGAEGRRWLAFRWLSIDAPPPASDESLFGAPVLDDDAAAPAEAPLFGTAGPRPGRFGGDW